jgi:histidine triad (HIT) family protein
MPDDCLFCRIVSGTIPATLVYENDQVVAFRDVDPKAPTHVLVIPREHVPSLAAATDGAMLGALLLAAREVANVEGLTATGFRTVINSGAHGGQTVHHLHVHVMGGRAMHWPPG